MKIKQIPLNNKDKNFFHFHQAFPMKNILLLYEIFKIGFQ